MYKIESDCVPGRDRGRDKIITIFPVLEHLFCFRTYVPVLERTFPVLERPFLF